MQYNTNSSDKKQKNQVPTRDDGQVGIRATLNNMGVSDSSIGYDQASGMVTLNGKNFMQPGYLDDDAGVSYASSGDIQKNLANFYKGTSNPVVKVSDAYTAAAGEYGLSADALGYSNGSVSIGGTPLDILYIDDSGKSWAWKNTVQNAAANYANNSGVQAARDLADEYERRYLSKASSMLNQLQYQKDFSYNPDTDPVFQAYQKKYRLEGERATRNAQASYAKLTGGYGNSSAATAGAQAGQYFAQQLTNTLPELAQQAYQRYLQKYQADLSLMNSMVGLYDTAYKNAASANNQQRDNVNAAAASNVARDAASYEKSQQDWVQNWQEMLNQQKYDQAGRDSYWNEVFNTQNITKNQYANEGLRLDNIQNQIYQQYYEQLLQAELKGSQLNHGLTQAQINQLNRK